MTGGAGRVLVTGSRGYLGSVLVPLLLAAGHSVVTFDRRQAGLESAAPLEHPSLEAHTGDLARVRTDLLRGLDAIIALAAMPDGADGDNRLPLMRTVNRDAPVALALAAKAQGVPQFLFASTCSVYGVAAEPVDEESPAAPITAYALAKLEAEQRLRAMDAPSFRVTCLRLATLFGAAPRLRLELLLNSMVASAIHRGVVTVPADGSYRPLLHVRDAAEVFRDCLAADHLRSDVVLNIVGHNTDVAQLGRLVADRLGALTQVLPNPADRRTYQVRGDKFERLSKRSSWRGVVEGMDEVRGQVARGLPHEDAAAVRTATQQEDKVSRWLCQ